MQAQPGSLSLEKEEFPMAKTWFAPEETAAFEFAQRWQREHSSTFVALVAQLEPVNVGGKTEECQIPFLLMGTDKRPYRLIVSLKKYGRIWQEVKVQILGQRGETIMAENVVRLFAVSESLRDIGHREGYYVVVGSEEPRLIMGEFPNRAQETLAEALTSARGSAYKSHGYDCWSARELGRLPPYASEVADILEFHGVDAVEDLADCYLLWYREIDENQFEQISSNRVADFIIDSIRQNVAVGTWQFYLRSECTVQYGRAEVRAFPIAS
jgi:hypothetical protein